MNLVARYGGDEFVAVLSEGDEKGAHGYLELLHAGIKETSPDHSYDIPEAAISTSKVSGSTMGCHTWISGKVARNHRTA